MTIETITPIDRLEMVRGEAIGFGLQVDSLPASGLIAVLLRHVTVLAERCIALEARVKELEER